MAYIKDSQGDDVQCEECEMYPAEYYFGDPDAGEVKSICVTCRQDKSSSNITRAGDED